MPTLESLKAEHPEWCVSCGREHQSDGHYLVCTNSPTIAALTAAKLEDEATIREKDARIAELITQRNECARLAAEQGIKASRLSYDLSAEQAAHAATKEELRKADEALIISRQLVPFLERDGEGRYNYAHEKAELVYAAHQAALARIQAQRAIEPKETK